MSHTSDTLSQKDVNTESGHPWAWASVSAPSRSIHYSLFHVSVVGHTKTWDVGRHANVPDTHTLFSLHIINQTLKKKKHTQRICVSQSDKKYTIIKMAILRLYAFDTVFLFFFLKKKKYSRTCLD